MTAAVEFMENYENELLASHRLDVERENKIKSVFQCIDTREIIMGFRRDLVRGEKLAGVLAKTKVRSIFEKIKFKTAVAKEIKSTAALYLKVLHKKVVLTSGRYLRPRYSAATGKHGLQEMMDAVHCHQAKRGKFFRKTIRDEVQCVALQCVMLCALEAEGLWVGEKLSGWCSYHEIKGEVKTALRLHKKKRKKVRVVERVCTVCAA